MPTKNRPRNFTDAGVQALRDFDVRGTFHDIGVKGLRLRVGARRMSWVFFKENRIHGTRSATCKLLGHFPEMIVADARKEALKIAGRIASDRIEPGKRAALKFDAALDQYLDHLRRKAERAGKPDRWARNVEKLGKQLLRPKWGKWSLSEMSAAPAAVAQWHREVTVSAGPVSANHCCRVIRAAYRRAARLDRSLPPHNPASAVEYNSETPSQKGLAFAGFPKWRDAWERIESPIRRAYHLTGLLTGARPGELARLKWSDVRPRQRSLVIAHAKAGADIAVPMSIEIVKALRMARDAGDESEELVFPGCAQIGHRDKLPARGNMLRHTFRTVCADLGVDELLSHFLMGHAPEGISQKYIARMILTSGPALRAAQRMISRRIFALLDPTARPPRREQAAPQEYREATLLPALP